MLGWHGRTVMGFMVLLLGWFVSGMALAQQKNPGALGPGDIVRITVFQQPDMSTEARVSDTGTVTFPLLGVVQVSGLTTVQAEARIAEGLQKGGFIVNPQVSLYVLQSRSRQVSVLGQVGRTGRYPMDEASTKLVDMLATAGGSAGADVVTLMRKSGDAYVKLEIDVPEMFLTSNMSKNIELENGDIVFVQRAPIFYIYGETARPGPYRVERKMTVRQAVVAAGGLTPRATDRDIRVYRRDAADNIQQITVELNDLVLPDDVIQVRQSLF